MGGEEGSAGLSALSDRGEQDDRTDRDEETRGGGTCAFTWCVGRPAQVAVSVGLRWGCRVGPKAHGLTALTRPEADRGALGGRRCDKSAGDKTRTGSLCDSPASQVRAGADLACLVIAPCRAPMDAGRGNNTKTRLPSAHHRTIRPS